MKRALRWCCCGVGGHRRSRFGPRPAPDAFGFGSGRALPEMPEWRRRVLAVESPQSQFAEVFRRSNTKARLRSLTVVKVIQVY